MDFKRGSDFSAISLPFLNKEHKSTLPLLSFNLLDIAEVSKNVGQKLWTEEGSEPVVSCESILNLKTSTSSS